MKLKPVLIGVVSYILLILIFSLIRSITQNNWGISYELLLLLPALLIGYYSIDYQKLKGIKIFSIILTIITIFTYSLRNYGIIGIDGSSYGGISNGTDIAIAFLIIITSIILFIYLQLSSLSLSRERKKRWAFEIIISFIILVMGMILSTRAVLGLGSLIITVFLVIFETIFIIKIKKEIQKSYFYTSIILSVITSLTGLIFAFLGSRVH